MMGAPFRFIRPLDPEAPERVILAGIEALGWWCAIAVTIDGFVESGCPSKLFTGWGGD